jgi:hypothetical protein
MGDSRYISGSGSAGRGRPDHVQPGHGGRYAAGQGENDADSGGIGDLRRESQRVRFADAVQAEEDEAGVPQSARGAGAGASLLEVPVDGGGELKLVAMVAAFPG